MRVPSSRVGVVIPVRSFTLAKARLAPRLDADARAARARHWATTVLRAAGDLPVVVVSSDPAVVAWAGEHGAVAIDDPGTLDGAAIAGCSAVRDRGSARALVVHADLPLARSFDAVLAAPESDVVIVPCHRGDGTPVLCVRTDLDFPFAYGPGSFARHLERARASGFSVEIVHDLDLAFDVDVPEDLDVLEHLLATEPPARPASR